ncbi:hypothetical protein XENOCAPTIV_019383 [Xenoophorus captivus]|uniref:Secreted protein n=1 Tax=Xenoophorus captivus TaxID=1517983 RepID=A0ABV0S9T0_9TELE
MFCFSFCRQSLCGTSFLQTTWTQTLWSAAGLGWRTSCSAWPLIQFFPTMKFCTTSSPRYGISFFCEHGWKEKVNETGFQAKADSRLRALSATFRVRSPHR